MQDAAATKTAQARIAKLEATFSSAEVDHTQTTAALDALRESGGGKEAFDAAAEDERRAAAKLRDARVSLCEARGGVERARLTIDIESARKAHREALEASQAKDAELAAAEDAHRCCARQAADAQAEFDADPAAKPRFVAAEDAKRSAKVDVDRARRLADKALAVADDARRAWCSARAELVSFELADEQLLVAKAPIEQKILQAWRLLMEARAEEAALVTHVRELGAEYLDATGTRHPRAEIGFGASAIHRHILRKRLQDELLAELSGPTPHTWSAAFREATGGIA